MSVKPAYTHSLVNLAANETMPAALLGTLCKEFGSFVGLVVREPTHLEIERFLDLGDEANRVKLLNQINEGTKKYPRQITFGQAPGEFDEDECQPWVPIRDSKNKPLLTISIEGDFPGRTSAEGYSEAFVMMHDIIGPKLEEIYKLSGNSPQKLFEYINGPTFKSDLINLTGHRCAVFCMPSVGNPLTIGNYAEADKGGADYKWGACSFNFGYADPAAEPAPLKEATMPKTPTQKTSKYADAPKIDPANIPAQEPKPSVPTVIPAKPGDVVEKVAEEILSGEEVKWTPPAGLHGKGLKKAYRDMLGHLPETWQQRPSFMIRAKKPEEEVQKPKDMKPAAPIIVLPVIDGGQQAKAVDFIKKHLGDGSVEIGNPLEAQKQEAQVAVFSEICLKTGDLSEINRWPVSGIFAFTKQNPEATALLLIELRRDRINRLGNAKDGDKTLGELSGTEKPAIPTEAPAGIPSKPVEPPPVPKEVPAAAPAAKRAGSKYA